MLGRGVGVCVCAKEGKVIPNRFLFHFLKATYYPIVNVAALEYENIHTLGLFALICLS